MPIEFYIDKKPIICETLFEKLNLLAHAQLAELDIGSQCGGHCICGNDILEILNSDQAILNSPSPEEVAHLKRAKKSAPQFRLACQTYPDTTNQLIQVRILRQNSADR